MKCIIVGCSKEAAHSVLCDEHETGKSSLSYQIGGSHYQNMAIQPIEYIHANKMPYMEANVVKYISRHRDKNGAEDVRKAIQYCEMILEMEYGES